MYTRDFVVRDWGRSFTWVPQDDKESLNTHDFVAVSPPALLFSTDVESKYDMN